MSRRPAPTRDDHDTFCTVEGWELVRGATGRPVAHHRTYELPLTDGKVLRTRISKPVDSSTYGASMWSAILRDQLCVTSDEFWRCVQDGEVPARGVRVTEPPVAAIPLGVVVQLKRLVGLDDAEIAEMTKDEAVDRLNAHWGDPG